MQISPYQTNQYQKPTFTHWMRDVKDPVTQVLSHRNDTCFFRDEMFLVQLADKLVTRYKDAQNVNVYCFGCSNGSEPYSLYMALDTRYPKEVVDKFNITGIDFDPVAIKEAKSNLFMLNKHEKGCIERFTENNFDKYFMPKAVPMREVQPEEYRELMLNAGYYNNQNDIAYSLRPEIQNKVNFIVGDIKTDYKKIEPDNSVVMARNFWPYLRKEEQTELAQNLYKQLNKNPTLVIGGFDFSTTDNLSKAGFKTDGVRLVWEK